MNVTRVRLDNGLVVILQPMREAPVVALQAWVNAGSADEDDVVAGVAHLHEHMLFKGTARRGVGEIARAVEAGGGEINAWTSFDQTVYHIVLASAELDLGLDVLADALTSSAFDAEELAREIEVVVEEIKRAEDQPSRRVSNAMFGLAYAKHPYRRPVLGSEATVRAMTRDRVMGFYERHYRPDNVTLVATGDFEAEAFLERVRAHFGAWRPKGPPRQMPPRPGELEATATRVRILREPVKEARFSLAWPIPGLRHADVVAIDVLSVILGHGESSRLFVETRRRRELVNDVYAYAYTPRDPGLLMIGAGLKADHVGEAVASTLDEAFRLRQHLVTPEELEKAKVIIGSDAAYQRETVQGEARRLGFFEVVAGDYAFEAEYRARLERLTAEEVRAAARAYLGKHPSMVAQLPAEVSPELDEPRLGALAAERFERAERRQRPASTVASSVERVQLDSGAVLLVRESDAPVVAARAVAYGGLRWEAHSSAGLGNLFSALWGLATADLPPEALARRTAMLGGSLSAFAGRNTIGMRAEFVREKARDGLALFCDAIVSPRFEAAELERERAVLLERVKSREDNPASIAFDAFAEALYPKHPYGLRSIGTEETLARFALGDIEAYHRTFATSDKLVIAVTGGMEAALVVDMLSRAFEEGKGPALAKTPPPDAPLSEPRQVRQALDKKQAHLIVGGMGVTLYDPARFALEVLTTILSGQSGRLFLELRDRQGLAYSVSSSSLEGLDPGHVLVHMGTSPDKVTQALAGLYREIDRLQNEPIGSDELVRAQRYLVGTHAIELQRSGARAMHHALGERFGLGFDEYLRYPEHIRGVTTADVQRVARTYLAKERLVEVCVGPT